MPNKWNLEEYNTKEDKWNLEKYTPSTTEKDTTSDFNLMQVLEGVYEGVNQAEAKPNRTSSAASNYLSGSKMQETNQPDNSYSNMPAEQNIPKQPEQPFEERNNIFNDPEYQKKSLVDKAGTITTNILNTVAGSGAGLGAGVSSAGDMLVDLSMQKDIQTPMEDYAEKSQQFAQERFEAGSWNDNLNVMESLKEGNVGEAISKGVQGAVQNSAQLAAITTMGILTGGASNAATSGLLNSTGAITQAAMQNAPLALIGASAGGSQYASLDDREDLSINQKVTSGLTATAIESATETYGSLRWIDDIMDKVPGARNQVVDSTFDLARKMIDPKKVAMNAGEEFTEELIAGFSNDLVNSIMGIDDQSLPEVMMNYEEYLNQGAIGAFSGAGMSIGAQIANTVMTPTEQQKGQPTEEIDLSNQISQQYGLPKETVDKIQYDINQILNSDPSEILQDSEMDEDNGIITTYQPDNQVDLEQQTEETKQEQPTEPIDLANTTQNQLLTVPGIGNKTSSRIIEYINENGVESVDDLANVSGIGQATLDKIRGKFTVRETVTEETTEQEVETPVEEEGAAETQPEQYEIENVLENQVEEWEILESDSEELLSIINEKTSGDYSTEDIENAKENYIQRRLEQLPDQNELVEDLYRTGVEFTKNIEEALWLFPNGTMIDGQFDMGSRGLDHRIIESSVLDNTLDEATAFWNEIHDKYKPIRLAPETREGLIKENQEITETQRQMLKEAGYETTEYLEDTSQENTEQQNETTKYEDSSAEELLRARQGLLRGFGSTEDVDMLQDLDEVEAMLDARGIEYPSRDSVLKGMEQENENVTEETEETLTPEEIDDQIDDLFFELEHAETETEQYEIRQQIDQLEQQRSEMINSQETVEKGKDNIKTVYRGKGRENKGDIYNWIERPILGEENYFAFDESTAQKYGSEVEQVQIDTSNFLEINNDNQWRNITEKAGANYPNPYGMNEQQLDNWINKVKSEIKNEGYDGVSIKLDNTDNTKLLSDVFGDEQIISFNDNNIQQNESIQQESEINQEQLSEMAKEYSSPDEFMESVVSEYGYLPDLGLNNYNDFRDFWADNTNIENENLKQEVIDSAYKEAEELINNSNTDISLDNYNLPNKSMTLDEVGKQKQQVLREIKNDINSKTPDETVERTVEDIIENPDNSYFISKRGGEFEYAPLAEKISTPKTGALDLFIVEGKDGYSINSGRTGLQIARGDNKKVAVDKLHQIIDSIGLEGIQSREQDKIDDPGWTVTQSPRYTGNLSNVNIVDGTERVLSKGTETTQEVENTAKTETTDTINLNSAAIDELTNIKGIGASTAQNIINYRDSKENGIENVDELKQVKGIGSATFDKIAPSFTAEQVDTTDTTDTIEEPTDSDITADEDVETESENLDVDEIAAEVDDAEGSINQTNELLSEEARDLMEFEDTDIRDYLDVVHLTSLNDLQTATETERNNIIDEIRMDDPDVADAIEAELEERAYESDGRAFNILKNFAEKSETGVEMEDVERYLQSARIKNQQLANRLQLPEIREDAIAQAYNLALEMQAQIQSADMDAEAEEDELLMGYFYETDEGQRVIKVRDIVDLENVGHEIGHMVHYELFGNPDGINFVKRLDTENLLNLLGIQVDDYNNIPDETVKLMNKMTDDLESTIKSEMLKISYDVVRPMKSKDAFMERYRASNSELMADYWVAYLTNHALAYDMAPKTTKMYDYALSKTENRNISNMVRTIRETLKQTSDNPDLQLRLITPEMAANLNPDKNLDLTTQAEKITAGADALIQEQKSFARLNVSDWAKVIPEEMQEDIIFYIEGTGNPIKGKSFEQIKMEIESNEEALQAVREIRYNFERVRQEWNNILREADSETRINYIENYAHRIWEDKKANVDGFYRSYNGSTTPQASQKRYYPTIVEGMKAGLTPETTNILTLYKDYVDRNARPIAMNSFKNYMLDLKDENGNPIVLTENEFEKNNYYNNKEIIDGRKLKPSFKESTRKRRYVRSHDNILSNKENMLVREDVYRYAREHLQNQIQKLKPISETNNLIKSLNYLFSGFHAFDLVFESGAGGLHFVKSPVTLSGNKYFDSVLPWERGMKFASYKPFLRTAIHSGLKINPMEDAFVGKLADATEKVVNWAEDSPIPFAEKPLQLFESAESKWQEFMWGKLYTGSKLNSFYGVLKTQEDVLPDNPTEEQIRAFYEAAADQVNQMYGGQDWSRIPIMSPILRQIAHLAIRAPDWTLSNIKIGGRIFKQHIENFKDYGLVKPNFNEMTTEQQVKDIRRKVVSKESAKYFGKMVIGVSIIMNILNFATVGRPTWENEGSIGTKFNLDVTPIIHKIQETLPFLERDEDDERRYYAMPFKQIREVFSFVQSPAKTIGYKTSPISQLAFEQIYGSQAGSGYDLGFYDDRADTLEKIGKRISRGTQTVTPFTFSGTNFALTLPLRRGISEYRAILEYEDSIENKLLREDTLISNLQQQFSTARDIKDIDKETMHNGLNPLELNKTAVANLRRKYSARLFEGITDEDTEKAEEAATALRRLRYFDVSSTAESRKEDYMTEVEAVQLMANPEILRKVKPLPLDILNPTLRFDDKTLQQLIQDMQREVGK